MTSLSSREQERALLGAVLLDNMVLEEHSLSEILFGTKARRGKRAVRGKLPIRPRTRPRPSLGHCCRLVGPLRP